MLIPRYLFPDGRISLLFPHDLDSRKILWCIFTVVIKKMETRPVFILVLFSATLYGAIGLTHSIGLGQNGIIELKFPDYCVLFFHTIRYK